MERSLTNESSQVNDFIRDLKSAGASPWMTIKILTEKLGVNLLKSKELVFSSPSWIHLDSGHNPFTEEFLKISSIDANEANIVNEKINSLKIDLNKDSNDHGN
jgi:hypothetical protein